MADAFQDCLVDGGRDCGENAEFISYLSAIGPAVTPYGESRLGDLFQGLKDEALWSALVDALILGEGMNTGDADPVTLKGLAAPSNTTTADWSQQVHGYSISNGNDLFEHAIAPSSTTDYTLVYLGSGDDTAAAERLVQIQNANGNGIQLAATNTNGFAYPRGFGPGFADFTLTADSVAYTGGDGLMAAMKWDQSVGFYLSENGGAFGTVQANTTNVFYAGAPTLVKSSSMPGTVQGWLIFEGGLSDVQVSALYSLLRRTVFTSNQRILGDGDSIMNIAGGGDPQWLERVTWSGRWAGATQAAYTELATGGHSAKQVYDDALAGALDAYAPTGGEEVVFIVHAGANDLNQADSGDYTNAKIVEHLTKTAEIAANLGMKPYIGTVLRNTGTRGDGGDAELIDAILRAKSGDGMSFTGYQVVDFDQALRDAYGASYEDDVACLSDGLHPTLAAKEEMAARFRADVGTRRG